MLQKKDWKALAIIAVFYGLLMAVGITCPIRYLTGISCAGCGMTRAWLAVLRLDWQSAWKFHPLWFLPVPTACILLLRHRLPARMARWSLFVIVGLFLAVYLIRMMQPDNTIVTFSPQEGMLYRGITTLLRAVCL